MDVTALLQALGYLHSNKSWVALDSADSPKDYQYRLIRRAGANIAGANIKGVYVYQTSLNSKITPPHPAVVVAEANSDEQARMIRKRLWNMGNCPFLIILSPRGVCVYTGFDYATDGDKGLITKDATGGSLPGLHPANVLSFSSERIDDGGVWEDYAKYLSSDTRVDYRLLESLKKLSQQLQSEYSLSREVAHSLIGKYIYLRYLRDRNILDDDWLATHGVVPDKVFKREAEPHSFEQLTQVLQAQFNGDIFPLPLDDDGRWRNNNAISYLAGIFNGDSPAGQLALDFQVYDFSYIPIELLSSIYEQFLKAEGKGEGDGVVYTSEALADYVLAEMEAVCPLSLSHKILDPCCGSGVFLALAYRNLIELWRQENEERPTAEELKRLLQENIFGIEKDREACDITAFSLILTLLSQLEPPELQANTGFQFPSLVEENIFCSDFFDNSCPVFKQEMRFDWIVGNPPWIKAKDKSEALKWVLEAKKMGREVGQRKVDEAFTWRASDLLKQNGFAGLLIMATTLVNSTSAEYRKRFFKTNDVRRVTNFSNMSYVLFAGRAKAPAVCLVYSKPFTASDRQPILHFGPFVTNQLPVRPRGGRKQAWTITLYEGDIQEIDYSEALADTPSLWKTALWGSYQDKRALRRLNRLLPKTIGEIVSERGWTMCRGPHVKPPNVRSTGYFISLPELQGQHILEVTALRTCFTIPKDALSLLPAQRQFIEQRGGRQGLKLIQPPHVFVSVEASVYSDEGFIISSPNVGIAAPRSDADYLKATALYLNSSVARYANFFYNATWGISRSTVNPENVGVIPFTDLSPQQIKAFAEKYEELAKRETACMAEDYPLAQEPPDFQKEVDAVVEDTLKIPDSIRITVRDFMSVQHQLLQGKIGDSASSPPTEKQLQEYAEQLRLQVDDFARRKHRITIRVGNRATIATVEVTSEPDTLPVVIQQQGDDFANRIMEAVREQHSQWVYIQRSVRIFEGSCAHIVKASRLLDWTRTQAVQDAGDLIAEALERTAPNYERATA